MNDTGTKVAVENITPLAFYQSRLRNPFLAALPDFGSPTELKKALSSGHPVPDETVRQQPAADRLVFLSELKMLHVALGRDVGLAHMIRELLVDRYAACMPVAKYVSGQRSRVDAFTAAATLGPSGDYEAAGHSLTGPSGLGKTRTIKRILRLIPQCCQFDKKKHPEMPPKIVVWVRVETPSNRKVSALIEEIFSELEAAMGEKIPETLKSGNISQSIGVIGQIVDELRLGVLVLDEVQHALRSNMLPDRDLMNFLVSLGNKLNVPILMIGTPVAKEVVGGQMRQARRMIGLSWGILQRGSKAWKELIAALHQMQFTKHLASLEFLDEFLFKESQGIPAIALFLFRVGQRYAILSGKEVEKLDEVVLNAVTEDFLGIIQPMIEALRSGNKDHLALFEDLFHDAESDETIAELVKVRAANRSKLVKSAARAGKAGAALIRSQTLKDAMALSGPGGLDATTLKFIREAVEKGASPAAALSMMAQETETKK